MRSFGGAVRDATRFSRGLLTRDLPVSRAENAPLRVAFVLEQSLGHATHSDNLARLVEATDQLSPSFLAIGSPSTGLAAKIPGYGNWTVRAGVRARRAVRRHVRSIGIDVMYVHTQVPAVLMGKWMTRIPTVVSLDATPLQYDEMGPHYGHPPSSRFVEHLKSSANKRCFQNARHLVVWSAWARNSLVGDYQLPPEKITIVSPGVDVARWGRDPSTVPHREGPVRVLFVGGDFERKGGPQLLEAYRRLRSELGPDAVELHLVTRFEIPAEPGIVIHRNLTANSTDLIALFHSCDIFCLPTLADSLGIVLSEAGASSLALVATDVGAISELVRDGETGLLVPPGDVDELCSALALLATDAPLRRRLGAAAHDLTKRGHDARENAHRIVELLIDVGRSPEATDPRDAAGSR
jgi:glycosyltransferase involved in cell wall biosynthesis